MKSIKKKFFPNPIPAPIVKVPSPDTQNRALSIKQPYAERILRGDKKTESRKKVTKIRGRVYIYASTTDGEQKDFDKMKAKPGDFPKGVLVGTVEIIGCEMYADDDYEWLLANPERFEKPIKIDKPGLPSWFIPFQK